MQFLDLKAQQAAIRPALDRRIAAVLDHGQFILGPEVAELEAELSAYCGAKHTVTCANGTDALVLALMALGIGRNDCVIVPSFTFCATAEAVCLVGGIPLFVDVLQDTYNMDPVSLKAGVARAKQLGLKLRAVITVDLFGQPCDYDAIEPIVRENSLYLICDAAQAFGAIYRGRHVGTIGDLTTTSFFPAKPLGCYGDGGAVFTDDHGIETSLKSLRVHGQGFDKYDNVRVGLNSRLDTIQAAILLEKLRIYQDELLRRDHAAQAYSRLLSKQIKTPEISPGIISTWAQYTVRTSIRGELLARLQRSQLPTAIYYRKPLHEQPAYRAFPCSWEGQSISADLSRAVLSLPMHAYLSDHEITTAVEIILNVMDGT